MSVGWFIDEKAMSCYIIGRSRSQLLGRAMSDLSDTEPLSWTGLLRTFEDHSHGPPFVGNESERQPVTCQPVAASRRVPRFLANECNNVGDKWAEKHAF